MRAVTAIRTVNSTLFAREGHRSVPAVVVQSLVDACQQCHGGTTSSTLYAHSVASRCSAVLSKSSMVGRTVARASYGLVVDNQLNRKFDISFSLNTTCQTWWNYALKQKRCTHSEFVILSKCLIFKLSWYETYCMNKWMVKWIWYCVITSFANWIGGFCIKFVMVVFQTWVS